MNPFVRILMAVAGLCMVIPGTITDLIGLVVLVLVVVYEYGMKKKDSEMKTA